jgi:molecular chaperone DnaJ
MNLNLNYYQILGVDFESTPKEIKKKYYKLSFDFHPDKGGDSVKFALINEAYTILTENKEEYDKKSKWGKDYSELEEFFKIDIEYNPKEATRMRDSLKKRILDIFIEVDVANFNGKVEFGRWVMCKTCEGGGKDMSNKILIKSPTGEMVWFEGDDGCDFCEGTGKSWKGDECGFCKGAGKVGINPCKTCEGEGRIMGKQSVGGIKLSDGEETIIKYMGNWSRDSIGDLVIYKKNHSE